MRSKVHFIKLDAAEAPEAVERKLCTLLEGSGVLEDIENGDIVAVKLTFGEKGNKGYVQPRYLRLVVDRLKVLGARPFLTDTNTLYKGERMNAVSHILLAEAHGFSPQAVGAPILIADGLTGEGYKEIKIDKKHFAQVFISEAAVSADAIFGVTHFTGHMFTGFGGAIKNIGMGFASKAGKLKQHSNVAPELDIEKCTGCFRCVEICPAAAIVKKDKKVLILPEKCIGCASCIGACRFDAIDASWSESDKGLQEKMAEYAYGALQGKKKGFVTFAAKITKECDCMAEDEPGIMEDVGILASRDPVALDKATVDLTIKKAGADKFKEVHPKTDWHPQLTHAAAIGLGNLKYELVEI